jgi:hypothetical protein
MYLSMRCLSHYLPYLNVLYVELLCSVGIFVCSWLMRVCTITYLGIKFLLRVLRSPEVYVTLKKC